MTTNDLATLARQATILASETDLPPRMIALYLLDGYTPEQIHAAIIVADACDVPLDTALYNAAHAKPKADEAPLPHPRIVPGYEDF